jgi:beta-fructofuranosidase
LEYLPPLLYPLVYDDVECPCVFQLNERFYLIGSIREDIKVRYWFADSFRGEYHSFHADVLLPQGNYAARTVKDGEHLLIYHFYFANGKIDALRVLPPPKQLDTDSRGRLVLKSYYRWDRIATKPIAQMHFEYPAGLFKNPTATIEIEAEKWVLTCKSGYELCCFNKPSDSFIWEGELQVEGMGKLGLVCDADSDGNGYYISLDVANGVVQIRAWGYNAGNDKSNFIFNNLQNHLFVPNSNKKFHFRLIRYGHYIELSIDGIVKLSLIDYTYMGSYIGIYSASSSISLQQSILRTLPDPVSEYASQENTIL